ncbi:S41 family peptidase [Tenacibaculum sp. SG-28]|uniref:S41 family peptidase n=1 Tax=Tenacibaculum sp. SG-28 TaxID=754426 RepID=UPI000CF3E086|nr:S41 family peptidase [Tenacibaculum sp. SG-28]
MERAKRYYLWQNDIPDLSDRRFSSQQQLNEYLDDFDDPNLLFESLLYQRGTIDKWSWIVDDYIALEQQFQGTTQTTGMEFGLVRYRNEMNNVFGYVRYVVPNTDAASQGVERGMLFSSVNGTQITIDNYRNLLFSENTSLTINLSNYNNGDPITNGTSINLTKNSYTENPIHLAKTINEGGKNIGYLMYNGFTSTFDSQLNQVFSQFKSDGVTELIIDLRYNGGGSVRTASYLGSMITGQFTGDVFSKQRWNEKYMNIIENQEILIDRFKNKIESSENINSLNLENIYFITTSSSASASELVINSLEPYINVFTVGEKTVGKYVGSVTLYDSPNLYTKEDINPNHNWAMQPIVLEIVNKNDKNDKDGIEPTVEILEDFGNLGVLGNREEPLLARTLQLITTGNRAAKSGNTPIVLKTISSSKANYPLYNNMYVNLQSK